MRTRPSDLDDAEVVAAVTEGWNVQVGSWRYVPEGGGSHHWLVVDRPGRSLFVTVDDLDDKDWLGDTRGAVFEGLRRALSTALALREDAGLEFVAAPMPSAEGEVVHRLGGRYAVSVRPFVVGESFPFGPHTDPDRQADVLEMVIAMHRATGVVGDWPAILEPAIGARDELDAFLEDPRSPWDGGPLAERARDLLASHVAALGEVVAGFDQLVESTAPRRSTRVVTHGEPHAANVVSVAGDLVLIDWDTVGLAQPERDLCLVAYDAETEARYHEATGHVTDPASMTLYRLRWYLDDIASAVRRFRTHPRGTSDDRRWFDSVGGHLDALDLWRATLS